MNEVNEKPVVNEWRLLYMTTHLSLHFSTTYDSLKVYLYCLESSLNVGADLVCGQFNLFIPLFLLSWACANSSFLLSSSHCSSTYFHCTLNWLQRSRAISSCVSSMVSPPKGTALHLSQCSWPVVLWAGKEDGEWQQCLQNGHTDQFSESRSFLSDIRVATVGTDTSNIQHTCIPLNGSSLKCTVCMPVVIQQEQFKRNVHLSHWCQRASIKTLTTNVSFPLSQLQLMLALANSDIK